MMKKNPGCQVNTQAGSRVDYDGVTKGLTQEVGLCVAWVNAESWLK